MQFLRRVISSANHRLPVQLFLYLYLVPFLLSSFCFLAPSQFTIVFIAWLVAQWWRYHWNWAVQHLGSFYCWVGSICAIQVWKGRDICIREEEIAPPKWRNGTSPMICRETWSQPQNNEPVVGRIKSFFGVVSSLITVAVKTIRKEKSKLVYWVFLEQTLKYPAKFTHCYRYVTAVLFGQLKYWNPTSHSTL